MVQAQKPAR